MEIVGFRELEIKDCFFQLIWLIHHWMLYPENFEQWITVDSRLRDGAIGFCAIEDDKLIGFVGVMDLTTRNFEGEEELAGGVWGVSTLPSHARRGISTSLMKKAHRYFEDRGYRFSFLTTSKAIIAYDFYRKLGYEDATGFPTAYKLTEKKSTEGKEERSRDVDWKEIARIYDAFALDKTGFVVRDEKYFKNLLKCDRLNPEMILFNENGYVIFKEEGKALSIRENIALGAEDFMKLVQQAERIAEEVVFDRIALDETTLGNYESLGYITQRENYELLMARPLTKDASFNQTYGNNFYMTNYDYF